ncbi:Tn3 family transposase [Shewanella sp. YLB-07]|uniref:Tn3 family transposase n=1 Tax=Shewanella sp. YLB-07 TaxID=2601268 RepID=UPI003A0FE2A9
MPCGQEDQLGALGLILNMIVYWNALYIEETVRQLKIEGFEVSDADIDKVFTFTF